MEISQKSTLAKLLASENISIEHRNVPTAAFDLANRKIILPLWKEMDEDLYDMLIGHEVSHALNTPGEGWHSAISEKGDGYKSFLNVVEDARIERMIKNKFPGLVKNFYKGYQNLFRNDFFGVADRDVQELPLIDRINLHYKIGNMLALEFSAEEQKFLDAIDKAETWEDVVAITEELFAFAKEEKAMQESIDLQFGENEQDDQYDDTLQGGDADGDAESQDEEDSEEGSQGDGGDTEDDTESEEAEGDTDDSMSGEAEDTNSDDPYSMTDKNFRQNEDKLLSEKGKAPLHVYMPNIDSYKFIRPIDKVWTEDVFAKTFQNIENYQRFDSDKTVYIPTSVVGPTLFNEFNAKNRGYINQMVQQFEMKRKASELSKARQNKTGVLNTDKLWATQLTEDVFLSNTVVPQGKNHGMMMFIDFSGSMYDKMADTIEQLLIQISFCKKVNIPFDVYGFTSAHGTRDGQDAKIGHLASHGKLQDGTIIIEDMDFCLNHLISSNLSGPKYKEIFNNLLMLKCCFFKGRHPNYYASAWSLPRQFAMGGTPLAETALVARNLINDFQKNYRVEIMNTLFLTDGGATGELEVYSKGDTTFEERMVRRRTNKFVVHEGAITTEVDTTSYLAETWYKLVLRHLKATTNTRLFNFHLEEFKKQDIMHTLYYNMKDVTYESALEQHKTFLKQKFLEIPNYAEFDSVYLIKSSAIKVSDDSLEVKSDKKSDLVRGFKNFSKGRSQSRVFLNNFIDKVA